MNINLANIDFCPGGKSATLTETTAEILLSETEKVIVPPEGTDGFNKVTITHAPVEESVSATITSNGTHTITPSAGFDAMFGVSVDVNVTTPVEVFTDLDGMKYAQSTINEFPSNFQFAPRTGESCINMFQECISLTSIPQLDTSNVTNMGSMFDSCKSLKTIPQLNTSKVTRMGYMFLGCSALTSISRLDATSLTDTDPIFGYNFYPLKKLTDFGGLTNLKVDLDLTPCTALTKESLLNVFNEAADVTASPKTMTLGSKNLAKLTDDEKAIATNKGWALA